MRIPGELVVWIDAHILVINKPSHLLTLPDGYDPALPHLKAILEPEFGPLWIVHRLDRETSGVLVLARTAQSHQALNTQFEHRQASKIYHAIVCGSPDWQESQVRQPLLVNGDHRHRTRVNPQRGKAAQTDLLVLERFKGYCLIQAIPQTGRTHQIRAHLASIDLPLLGDPLYGGSVGLYLSQIEPGSHGDQENEPPLLNRVALHAWSLTFEHPDTKEKLTIEAPYPKDFQRALQMMRRYVRFM